MASAHRTLRLAPGAELCRGAHPSAALLRLAAAGTVHLNGHALAILELCDGSRTRERIIRDALKRSPTGGRADDVAQFLDAARARGWLAEG